MKSKLDTSCAVGILAVDDFEMSATATAALFVCSTNSIISYCSVGIGMCISAMNWVFNQSIPK